MNTFEVYKRWAYKTIIFIKFTYLSAVCRWWMSMLFHFSMIIMQKIWRPTKLLLPIQAKHSELIKASTVSHMIVICIPHKPPVSQSHIWEKKRCLSHILFLMSAELTGNLEHVQQFSFVVLLPFFLNLSFFLFFFAIQRTKVTINAFTPTSYQFYLKIRGNKKKGSLRG